ncbi:Alpha-1,4-N-acetylgalactosamine transferase PglH [hydrothermal vent metagenome]|uniref:Alpha-1,4-N-acetylgalactosamine transferase PglH n=1 Tax=hydrothermal vent metagenome TaxID=652676 RepID=A0A3B1B3M1_9ZZZZ
MQLTIVTSSLSAGGAERVLSIMANYWASHGHCIHFLTLDAIEGDFYALDPKIQRHALGLLHGSNSLWGTFKKHFLRLLWIRRIIKESQPDAVICFMDRMNVATLVATHWLTIPVIISERIDPEWHHIGIFWNILRRLMYPYANILVVQTETVRNWAKRYLPDDRITIIPNPLESKQQTHRLNCPIVLPEQYIVAMGRMVPQKGFDTLLSAFASLAEDFNHWELIILGDGSERNRLQQQAKKLGIDHRLHMPGRISPSDQILEQAEIFILSSRYEGFPNALLEAMRAGVAVISFDCPSGPAEIIHHGVDGLLVPAQDSQALTQAITKLIQDRKLRQSLGDRAKDVKERFSLEKVMRQWQDVIETVSSDKA